MRNRLLIPPPIKGRLHSNSDLVEIGTLGCLLVRSPADSFARMLACSLAPFLLATHCSLCSRGPLCPLFRSLAHSQWISNLRLSIDNPFSISTSSTLMPHFEQRPYKEDAWVSWSLARPFDHLLTRRFDHQVLHFIVLFRMELYQ